MSCPHNNTTHSKNMTNSQDSSCFSSIFRRLLCAGGLPTHPSSDADNPPINQHDSSIKLPPSPTRTTTPAGIIARLMGLDSFPNSPRSTTLATIMRKSKSVSSVDFLPNFEITNHPPHHRRIKTSLSFRELPTTFLQASHHNELKKVGNNSEMGLTPIEEKSKNLNKKIKKKKINKGQTQSLTMKVKSEEKEVKVKCTRKRGVVNVDKKKVVEDGFHPEEQKIKKKKYKSRNTRYNHDHPLPKMGKHAHDDDDRKVKKKTMLKRRESQYSEEYCMNVLVEICRLTMEEIEGGVWIGTKVVNNLQEISYEISQDILQVLVYEMVHDLCS